MWSIGVNKDNEFYLFYDRSRRFNQNSRGLWEVVGRQGSEYTNYCARVNENAGLMTCNDNEGNVRVLVLE